MKTSLDLPEPDTDARYHSERLCDLIRNEIPPGASLPFERYMDLALYAPGLGYYRAGASKFGPSGDFVTAPEISALFGQCVATQCRQVLAQGGGAIMEIGPGSGVLAATVLQTLADEGVDTDYYLLELSGELRERQYQILAATVPDLLPRVQWLDHLPEHFDGVILGNEVVDAIPVTRFEITAAGPRPLHVQWTENGFGWTRGPEDETLSTDLATLQTALGFTLPQGYRSERQRQLRPWLASLADSLNSGVILLIDYGHPQQEFYHPQRNDGTLLCHYRHRVHDNPFLWPGLQDITASVDFTALGEAALAAGLEVQGYTPQAQFLLSLGLTDRLAATDPDDRHAYLTLTQQVKRLTLPGEMGERCKVMALGRNAPLYLQGFNLLDDRKRL